MDDKIAVIGVGCRFPGAPDPAAFWRNLRAGADTLSWFNTDQLLAAGWPADLVRSPAFVPVRGTMPGGELFDWRYFGYSRGDAALIDPQQRVFLEVCVAALQDAAVDPARFPGWIGVYAGCDTPFAPVDLLSPAMMSQVIGREKDFLATRVAYKLRLRGPAMTVQSLREGTKAEAVRRARTCYDHLAGRLGVALMGALLRRGVLAGGDGEFDPDRAERDRLSAPGWDVAYVLTDSGRAVLGDLGIDCSPAGKRPFVRYCVDWSEQRHHLAGMLGARMLDRFEDLRWIERRTATRAVTVTAAGLAGLDGALGLDVTQLQPPSPRTGLLRAG